jgi:hypothetical protein
MLIVTASGRHGPPHHLALTGSPAGGGRAQRGAGGLFL